MEVELVSQSTVMKRGLEHSRLAVIKKKMNLKSGRTILELSFNERETSRDPLEEKKL